MLRLQHTLGEISNSPTTEADRHSLSTCLYADTKVLQVKANGPRRPQGREAQPQLPSSLVWDTSCQQLAAPLLDAQVLALV